MVVTISFWSRPNHYGQVQINLVRPKPFWTDQNCFGHTEGQGNCHTGVGHANGELNFGIQQNPSILPSIQDMQYDLNSNYPGAAVPPPYTPQDNGVFHPPNYAKF